jgi:hypothetical protein
VVVRTSDAAAKVCGDETGVLLFCPKAVGLKTKRRGMKIKGRFRQRECRMAVFIVHSITVDVTKLKRMPDELIIQPASARSVRVLKVYR